MDVAIDWPVQHTLLGYWLVQHGSSIQTTATGCLAYDIILGILGTTATLTAARDFPHRHVINRPGESGTLSHGATQSEMVEHAFYQFLNLWQALYLHTITWAVGSSVYLRSTLAGRRMVLLWGVTHCPGLGWEEIVPGPQFQFQLDK